ncbi:MAG: hypothetical protein WKF77_11210 [Planctomycetaceae bacterium]
MSEIDEKAESIAGRFQVVVKLCAMVVNQLRYGLEFKNNFAEANEIWFKI